MSPLEISPSSSKESLALYSYGCHLLIKRLNRSHRKLMMDYGRILCAVIGFSASYVLCLPYLKKSQRKRITDDKLRMVSKALEQAEERLVRCEERHDRILSQICSFYLSSEYLDDALAGCKDAMNEASEFVSSLRRLQMDMITSYPGADVPLFD